MMTYAQKVRTCSRLEQESHEMSQDGFAKFRRLGKRLWVRFLRFARTNTNKTCQVSAYYKTCLLTQQEHSQLRLVQEAIHI